MPILGGPINEMKQLVFRYLAGELPLVDLFPSMPKVPHLGSVSDDFFPTQLYCFIHPLGAVVSSTNGKDFPEKAVVEELVQSAFVLRGEIERRRGRNLAYSPKSSYEEDGQLYREERFAWAIETLDWLKSYGYQPRSDSS